MHKRIIQTAMIFGVLSIPTFASADVGLLGNTLNKSSNLVETVTNGVADTVSDVQIAEPTTSETEEVIKPITKIADSVNETTRNVMEAVQSESPIVEVNVSEKPSIKVNAGVIEAEVSSTPKVKVKTPITNAEIDDSVKAEVDSIKVDAQVKNDKKPQINVQTPVVNVVTTNPEQQAPPTKVPESPEAEKDPEQAATQKQNNTKPVLENDLATTEQLENIGIQEPLSPAEPSIGPVKPTSIPGENVTKKKPVGTLPSMPVSEYDQLKVTPALQTGPSTPTNTVGSSGNMPFTTSTGLELTMEDGATIYPDKMRLFYDQWLNAPPSQPPQHSLFTISSI